ncbi:sugar ABC transporter substrate-binding protein [Anaerocolumna cellulosilytica]|uniref:Sugar ABC transporter substrate-binding protein n=1 Tax=Anaerocolumna cellulosilytica TaxID=433286 RepID=A0A6S6QZG9_9FIRM|nr:sugar ABC transporter substrate-binding protein [Anaerocolumna cellulosilytica]MBB5197954.1 multiple sugar transport system substrate-binding protein [Anaerocolumna cellulosilytica]BCJ95166.1 sugar ABC transporter substrate-binding protein [Anaerocolumna cellulosilytica]
MKRRICIILVFVLLLTALAGCSNNKGKTTGGSAAPTSGGDNSTNEPITLKWSVWDINSTTYYQPLIDTYEAAHENVKIEMVDLGSADYMTVLATELTGNDSDIDIATIKDIPGYATLVEKNALEPLNSYIKTAGIDVSVYGGITNQIIINDRLYALPFRSDFWVLFYNKEIFDAAGVDYPTNDMTFEQYDELARKVTNTTLGAQGYGAHYHTWRSAVQLFGILDGKNSIVGGNYDFLKPYYELVLKQQEDQVVQDYATLKTSSLHYSGAFAQGNVAMMNMGTWFIPTLIEKIDSGEYTDISKWGLAKYPHAEGVEPGSTLATITSLAVTTASKHKEAAFDFLEFITSSEGAKVIASTGTIPAIKTEAVIESISSMEGFPEDEGSAEALQTANTYLEMPVHVNSSEIETILNTAHDNIMSGNATIEEGIEYMNTEVGKLLQ